MKFYWVIVLLMGNLALQVLYAQPANLQVDCEEYAKDADKITCMLPYAKQGDIDAQARIGTLFLMNKEYKLAVYWLSRAADRQQTVGMDNLALAYEVGLGVKKDRPKALQLYTASAKLGSSHAQHRLGVIYRYGRNGDGRDLKKAYYWFLQAAKQNNTDSLYSLGDMYMYGDGVPEDIAKGLAYFHQSAQLGDKDAQQKLGELYMGGLSVLQDDQQAFFWLEKAAKQGQRYAQQLLSELYEKGQGVKRDRDKAIFWRYESERKEQRPIAYWAHETEAFFWRGLFRLIP